MSKFVVSKLFLVILLSCVGIDEICNNTLFETFSTGPNLKKFILIGSLLVIQICIAPIQASLSDLYCRKKSLIIALMASFVSILILMTSFTKVASPILIFPLVIIIKGCFGNTLPIACAGIADTQKKNYRFSLALSTSTIGMSYFLLIVLNKMIGEKGSFFIILSILLFLVISTVLFFQDLRDKEHKGLKNNKSIREDVKMIFNDFLNSRRFLLGIITFLLWEISFYSMHMLDVDMHIKEFKDVTLWMVLGYLVGSLSLRFFDRSDKEMIKIGYIGSILSIIPIFVITPWLGYFRIITLYSYAGYAFSAAYMAPSLFSTLSKERKPHEQGKIYGLIDSTDTMAFLLTSTTIIIYSSLELGTMAMPIFSLIMLLLSGVTYAAFIKTEENPDKRIFSS
jgi:hypothetical protein